MRKLIRRVVNTSRPGCKTLSLAVSHRITALPLVPVFARQLTTWPLADDARIYINNKTDMSALLSKISESSVDGFQDYINDNDVDDETLNAVMKYIIREDIHDFYQPIIEVSMHSNKTKGLLAVAKVSQRQEFSLNRHFWMLDLCTKEVERKCRNSDQSDNQYTKTNLKEHFKSMEACNKKAKKILEEKWVKHNDPHISSR
jgi:hypothetical protein